MEKVKKIFTVLFLIGCLILSQGKTFAATNQVQNIQEGKKIASTIDDVFAAADGFIRKGSAETIDKESLSETSDFLYNLLLGIGIIVAVIVGVVLGIKYMTASVEEKAELKESMLGYFVSCVVIFGAFGIWKIVVNVMSSL